MPDTENPAEAPAADKPIPPKRSPGHRGADVRDTVAEMAAKAHEISLEAGSKMAAAMKDVIGAAAGLSAFSIESSRDLVQFMVRRSQMTQEEADKLIIEAEGAWLKKNKGKLPPAKPDPSPAKPVAPAAKPPAAKVAPAAKAAPAKAAPAAAPKAAPAAAKAAPAPAAKAAPAPAAKAPAAKVPVAKVPVAKAAAAPAAKKAAPAPAKKAAPAVAKKPAPKK